MVNAYNRLEKQCVRCKYSEFEYGNSILTGWFNCKRLKQHDCSKYITSCPLYEYAPRLEQLRTYYGLIDGDCGLKDKEDTIFLKFHTSFFEVLIDGSKTATTRLDDKGLQVNDVITAQFVDDEDNIIEVQELPLKIMSIESIKYKELNNHHAFNEGYLHKNLLKRELERFYPDITNDTLVYVYRFDCFIVE